MTPFAQDLEQLLRAERQTLEALADVLDAEHQALTANDPQQLEDVTARKNAAIEAHQRQQTLRLSWMSDAGLPADTPLEDLVVQSGGRKDLGQLQSSLAELAQECQQRNRRNGGLIVRLQERTRGALDVLRSEETSKIYSLSGAKEGNNEGRTLGKA